MLEESPGLMDSLLLFRAVFFFERDDRLEIRNSVLFNPIEIPRHAACSRENCASCWFISRSVLPAVRRFPETSRAGYIFRIGSGSVSEDTPPWFLASLRLIGVCTA